MVPISRQPKDKIQAIIDSCTRQFPEFSERSRKRIRTYLKSCRRTRRHKVPIPESVPSPSPSTQSASVTSVAGSAASEDPHTQASSRAGERSSGKGKEGREQQQAASTITTTTAAAGAVTQPPASPTSSSGNNNGNAHEPLITCAQLSSTSSSYHLTSRLAEQILATACDNEYQNAQRIRQGLTPLYQESASPPAGRSLQDHLSDAAAGAAGDQHQMLKSGTGKNSLKYDATSTMTAMTAAAAIMSAQHQHQQTNGFAIASSSPSSSSLSHDQQQICPAVAASSSSTPAPSFLTGASSGAAVHVLTPAVSAHTTSSSLLAALCSQQPNRSPSDGQFLS